jgi:hypothetical protein
MCGEAAKLTLPDAFGKSAHTAYSSSAGVSLVTRQLEEGSACHRRLPLNQLAIIHG